MKIYIYVTVISQNRIITLSLLGIRKYAKLLMYIVKY